MRFRNKFLGSLSSTISAIYVGIILLFLVLASSVIYSVANRQVDQSNEETMNSLMSQKTDHLSSLYQDIFEQFYTLTKSSPARNLVNQQSPSSENYLNLSEEVDDFYYRNAALVDSIYINIQDNYEFTVSEQQSLNHDAQLDHLFHPQVPEREGYFWLNNHEDLLFDRNQDVQTIVYYEKNNMGSGMNIFVLNLRTAYVDNILNELSMEDSYMMLLSPEGFYVPEDAPSQDNLNTEIFQRYQGNALANETQEIRTDSFTAYTVRNHTLGTNKWEVVLVTPKKSLIDMNTDIPFIFLFLFAILTILIIIIIQMIQKYISNPIEKLAAQMRTTESYDEKLVPTNDVPQELSVLYETYNTLSDRNTRLIKQMEIEQEEKLELELALLHAQISPHFLYNTLYSIKGLVDMEMNKEASAMVLNLSDFLRTSLSRGREIISIREELKNIESYLFMMNMRYGDYFDYEIKISDAFLNDQIVKLTLQPLVENAIYHGVMHSREKGFITIGSEKYGEDLIIYVEDNGKGIPADKLQKIKEEFNVPYLSDQREETGVGLRSVDIRVKNRYGGHYGLDIDSVENEYTRISVRLPIIKGEDNVV